MSLNARTHKIIRIKIIKIYSNYILTGIYNSNNFKLYNTCFSLMDAKALGIKFENNAIQDIGISLKYIY